MKKITIDKSNLKIIIDKFRTLREYIEDYKSYVRYSMYMSKKINNYDYLLLIKAHSIEKGMSMKELRPFGQRKVVKLYETMCEYDALFTEKSFGYKVSKSIIIEWIKIFEKNNWIDDEVYKKMKQIYKDEQKEIDCGCKIINDEEIKNNNFETLCFSRYSTRNFLPKKISDADIEYCANLANKAPSACNRQMCKIYSIENEENKSLLCKLNLGLSGFDKEKTNYFLITYDISAFNYYGERNQGFFNAGLFSMNFIYAMQSKKIGSCCLQWNVSSKEEKKIKKILSIPENEKIAVVIGAGYINEKSLVPSSNRRNINEILIKR